MTTDAQATEAQHQAALFDFLAAIAGRVPAVAWAFHVPNGEHRHKAVAVRLKAQGVKAGVPDVLLPVRAGGFVGLVLELKRPSRRRAKDGGVAPEQERWLDHLEVVGWNVQEFDLPLILAHVWRQGTGDARWGELPPVIDLMAACKAASKAFGRERWYKLQDVSVATLGRGKDGDGKQAAQDLASDDPERRRAAASYCRGDVQLVIDLFAAAQGDGLVLPGRPERGEGASLRLWLTAEGEIADCRREASYG